jgi:hypothetical protein
MALVEPVGGYTYGKATATSIYIRFSKVTIGTGRYAELSNDTKISSENNSPFNFQPGIDYSLIKRLQVDSYAPCQSPDKSSSLLLNKVLIKSQQYSPTVSTEASSGVLILKVDLNSAITRVNSAGSINELPVIIQRGITDVIVKELYPESYGVIPSSSNISVISSGKIFVRNELYAAPPGAGKQSIKFWS